jgi:hypothetical protein
MAPKIGRYSDAYKSREKVDKWKQAEKAFDEKNYPEMYKNLFDYISDDAEKNVSYTQNNGSIEFKLYQGTSIVKGTADAEKVTAEAEIAQFEKTSVAFMRRLLEMNYSLFYSRFCIKDNKICMTMYSNAADAYPGKLYYGLREVARRSDKQDELLLEDFSMLKPVPEESKEPIPDAEKEVRYKYMVKWMSDVFAKADTMNQEKYSGGISFLLLNLLYKIDYLVSPQGTVMNRLEKINMAYYMKDNKSYVEKNNEMIKQFKEIAALPKEEIFNSLYSVRSAFSLVDPANLQTLGETIKNESDKNFWWMDNDHPDIALAVLEFIPTKAFFSFGMPGFLNELFVLLLNVMNQDYFNELGAGKQYYDPANNMFNQILLAGDVKDIIERGREQFPELKIAVENFKYESLYSFVLSYLREIEKLDYRKQN